MPRKKSSHDLYEQSFRLIDQAAHRGWTGKEYTQQSLSRIDRIAAINKRYQENIRKKLNPSSDYLTNSQYDTPVSRRLYMGLSAG